MRPSAFANGNCRTAKGEGNGVASMRPSAFANGNVAGDTLQQSRLIAASMRPLAFANGNAVRSGLRLSLAWSFNEAVGFRQRESGAGTSCSPVRASMRPSAFANGNAARDSIRREEVSFNEAVGFRQREFSFTQITRVCPTVLQ